MIETRDALLQRLGDHNATIRQYAVLIAYLTGAITIERAQAAMEHQDVPALINDVSAHGVHLSRDAGLATHKAAHRDIQSLCN